MDGRQREDWWLRYIPKDSAVASMKFSGVVAFSFRFDHCDRRSGGWRNAVEDGAVPKYENSRRQTLRSRWNLTTELTVEA